MTTMNSLISLLKNWAAAEPVGSLWLAIASVALFGSAFVHLTREAGLGWARSLFVALARSLVIVVTVLAGYFLLDSGFKGFSQLYGASTSGGSLSNRAWQQWRNLYGGPYSQTDLQVVQYVTVTREEVIPPSEASTVPLYRNITTQQPTDQNSIIGFRGNAILTAAGGYNNPSMFNPFALAAEYEYDIVNSSTQETRAEFRFPLSPGTKLYRDIVVTIDGDEADWRVAEQSIYWEERLAPGQRQTVDIRFHTWGENDFTFEVPQQREITNFSLKLTMNTDNCWLYTTPENGGIQLDVDMATGKKIIEWKIERTIVAPRLTMDLRAQWPFAPYFAMTVTLSRAASASTLFLAMVIITLLLCSVDVRPAQLALLALLFMLPFLILISGGVPHPASVSMDKFADFQAKLLPVLTSLSLVLALLVLRKIPRLPLVLILVLLALFAGGYPLLGLLFDEQKRKAIETILQVGMIAYVFLLALFTRLSKARGPGTQIQARAAPHGFAPWRALAIKILPGLAVIVTFILAISLLEFHPPALLTPPLYRIEPGINGLQFYNTACADPADQHKYAYYFAKRDARCIFVELYENYVPSDTDPEAALRPVFHDPHGQVIEGDKVPLAKNAAVTTIAIPSGGTAPANWQIGIYRVELFLGDKLVAAGEFQITAPSLPSPSPNSPPAAP